MECCFLGFEEFLILGLGGGWKGWYVDFGFGLDVGRGFESGKEIGYVRNYGCLSRGRVRFERLVSGKLFLLGDRMLRI